MTAPPLPNQPVDPDAPQIGQRLRYELGLRHWGAHHLDWLLEAHGWGGAHVHARLAGWDPDALGIDRDPIPALQQLIAGARGPVPGELAAIASELHGHLRQPCTVELLLTPMPPQLAAVPAPRRSWVQIPGDVLAAVRDRLRAHR